MQLSLNASLDDLYRIREFVKQSAHTYDVDEALIGDLILAIDEAVTNIITHGYRNHQGTITLEINKQNNDLLFRLRDMAPVYNPVNTQAPDLRSPLQRETSGGYGVYLIKRIMDEVRHNITTDGGNELVLIKHGAINKI